MLEIKHCDVLQGSASSAKGGAAHNAPAIFDEIIKETLLISDLVLSRTGDNAVSGYAASNDMLKWAFIRLPDWLSTRDPSNTMRHCVSRFTLMYAH